MQSNQSWTAIEFNVTHLNNTGFLFLYGGALKKVRAIKKNHGSPQYGFTFFLIGTLFKCVEKYLAVYLPLHFLTFEPIVIKMFMDSIWHYI